MAEDENLRRQMMIDRDAAALAVYTDLKESQRATFQIAAEWGRWLIGSLVLIHSGALFGMFSLLNSNGGGANAQQSTMNVLQEFRLPVWFFVAGLLLALSAGLFAWLNWSMHSANYMAQARYDMLWNSEKWVGDTQHHRGLDLTHAGSITSGLLSAACIVGGAATILNGDFLAALFK
ncbi:MULTISPECIES: hypothetical protein [unclassified Mesorhizobium]|uniref:hypothetical protein n=1 Tax=unclassified Mesorhizobium TaxID=325217 RepID=UPI000F74E027|nr:MULTISPECIES: hypothetical protein [unclassified Mesorhizobium]AZO75339.1 hypothetical protein EJ067_32310 [Mesorhizobium sp. M1D.F.Ca.ET.043.01.1.1]RWA87687.1 MAG: hypothetical protein EOQ32_24080 [Mesorhizobium sp.]